MKRFVFVLAMIGALACGSDEACTEIGCENDATVTFSGGSVQGPYDLVVEIGDSMFTARCADPGAPEVADNSPEVTCSASGFELVGDAALGHSVYVTVVPEGMDAVAERVEVLLSVVDEQYPNGEGCEPVCYSRTGQLILQ